MILRPKPPLGPWVPAPEAGGASQGLAPVPAWLRVAGQAQGLENQGNRGSREDYGFAAGAATALLDRVVRGQEKWGGVWRQRLAIAAAAASAKRAGRVEDEAALRDAVLLTRPGDDVGPAGFFALAWRRLVALPAGALLSPGNLAAALGEFGLADADGIVADLAGEFGRIVASGTPMFAAVGGGLDLLQAGGRGWERDFGPWLADAIAANVLGWPRAVPLFGTLPGGRSMMPGHEGFRQQLSAGFVRSSVQAIDLSAELGRRAERLLSVAPKLRAKGADAVIEMLLSSDALAASLPVAGISDRGLRRLFERLVEFGAVRELSGRPTFRLYGL